MQRRVDLAFGFSYLDTAAIQLIVPTAAMKINTVRLIDEKGDLFNADRQIEAKLEIVLDSLAARYTRVSYRTRSHADQQEIDPTDMFFSFTADAANTERVLFWGKKSLAGSSFGGTGGGGGTTSPYRGTAGGGGGGGGGGGSLRGGSRN
jgi:uncharacterized membrane protein YgcG